MAQIPSKAESERRYLVKYTHTRIIICKLKINFDFKKTLKIFFFQEMKFLYCYS